MAIELGAGYVSLTVEARNVAREIATKVVEPIERAMSKLGRDAGKQFSAEFAEATSLGGADLGRNLDEGFGRLGTDAGNDFARQFNQETRNLGDKTTSGFIAGTRGLGDHGTTSGGHFARSFAASTIVSFGALATKLGVILAVGVGAGVGLLVGSGIVKDTVDMASNFNEQISKINVVFGDSAEIIKTWSETSATAMGISQVKALESIGTFGNLFSSMGIGTEQTKDMSIRLVELASDLGSFNNVPAEDALIALKSGLVGETEPMRNFASNLTDARIKAEAFRLGLVEAEVDQSAFSKAQETADKASREMAKTLRRNGAGSVKYADAVRDAEQASSKLGEVMGGKIPDSLTAAQKAQAAYSLILADTSLAHGDFSRTSEGLAAQQKILGAEVENLQRKIGKALLPGALRLVVAMRTHVLPALERFAIVFEKDIIPAVQRATGWIKQNVVPVFVRIGQVIRDDVIPALQIAAKWIGKNVVPVLARIGQVIRDDVIPAVSKWIRQDVVPVLVRIGQIIRDDVVPALERFGMWVRDVAIPAIVEFAKWLRVQLEPAGKVIQDRFEKLGPRLSELGDIIVRDLLPPLKTMWEQFQRDVYPVLKDVTEWMLSKMIPAFGEMGEKLDTYLFPILGQMIKLLGTIITSMNMTWQVIMTTSGAIATFVTTAKARIEDFIDTITGLPGKISGAAAGMWDGIKESFRSMLNDIIGWWNTIEFKLPSISVAGRKVGGQTIDPPNIAELATGGVINRPTLAMVGETARATPEIVAPQRLLAETFRDELRRFSPLSQMAPVRIEHFHSTEPSRTVLEEMQWRIATGVL